MNTIRLALLASTFGIVTPAFAGVAEVPLYSWEVASEFNDASNNNNTNCTLFTDIAPWCYGYEPVAKGVGFTPFGFAMNRGAGIQGWGLSSTNSLAIVHNQNPYYYDDNVNPPIPPHALDFLPGNNCEYAVLRFVSPYKSKYKISGQFYGLWDDNTGYENADVHIYVNNAPVYDSLIDMHNGPTHVSFTTRNVFAPPGVPIDFIVGCGTNGDNYYDHVGLNAVIERLR